MKHTELPWRVNEYGFGYIEKVSDHGSDNGIATTDNNPRLKEENEANAEFIVKAVNSFYGLVDALEAVDDFMNGHDDGLGLHQVVLDALKEAGKNETKT